MNPIAAPSLAGMPFPLAQPTTQAAPDAGFGELLQHALGEVNGLNTRATGAIETSLVSGDLAMVETFTAVREADLALRLMLQVRNKLVDAYQEIQQLRF